MHALVRDARRPKAGIMATGGGVILLSSFVLPFAYANRGIEHRE